MKNMKNNIQNLTLTALMAAIICIMGPIVIPIGMVPVSFANMAIYLTIILLDKKKATISVAVYLLLGLVGIPVFSGFTGGAGKLFGPTGGYLIGYLALSWIAGTILENFRKPILVLATGTIGLYFFGTLWLMYQSNLNLGSALSIGVVPFIPLDIIKIIAASLLGKSIKERINTIL